MNGCFFDGAEIEGIFKGATIMQKGCMQIQIPDLVERNGRPSRRPENGVESKASRESSREQRGSAGILNEMASQDQEEWRRAISSLGWGCDYAKLCI